MLPCPPAITDSVHGEGNWAEEWPQGGWCCLFTPLPSWEPGKTCTSWPGSAATHLQASVFIGHQLSVQGLEKRFRFPSFLPAQENIITVQYPKNTSLKAERCMDLRTRQAWVWIPALPFTSNVAWASFLTPLHFSFFICTVRIIPDLPNNWED